MPMRAAFRPPKRERSVLQAPAFRVLPLEALAAEKKAWTMMMFSPCRLVWLDVKRRLDDDLGVAGNNREVRLCGHFGDSLECVPGEQFADARDGVVGDAGQHLAEIGFWIQAVELGRADQAVNRRRALPAGI